MHSRYIYLIICLSGLQCYMISTFVHCSLSELNSKLQHESRMYKNWTFCGLPFLSYSYTLKRDRQPYRYGWVFACSSHAETETSCKH